MASHDVFDRRFAKTIADMDMQQLQAKRREIEADPANRNPPGVLFIYTKKARGKLAAIAFAISSLLKEKP